jgi:hypothetical protein
VHVRPAQPQRLTDPQARIPQQDHQELVAGTAAARKHRLGLLIGQRIREPYLRPRLQRPGPHRPELAGLPGIEPRRGEPQPPRLRQLLGHRHLEQCGHVFAAMAVYFAIRRSRASRLSGCRGG